MSEKVYRRTVPVMGTLVTIDVVTGGAPTGDIPTGDIPIGDIGIGDVTGARASHVSPRLEAAVERAFAWFYQVEEICTRFDPQSELARLSAQTGVAVSVSALLFQAVQFALAVAEETGGAFDPTVGAAMEMRGFNREHRSGRAVQVAPARSNSATHGPNDRPNYRPSYRDVRLDLHRKTITLLRPLLLDLGAVAKGLAIDMAAHELRPFAHFAINAGGDVYLGGHNAQGAPWSVGIRHPRVPGALIDSLRISERAVCTSGDYERRRTAETEAGAGGHHILNPRSASSAGLNVAGSPVTSAQAAASVTVVAPSAMLADALSTAAFVLGPEDGITLLERLGVDGLIITPALERYATRGMCSDYEPSSTTIFPDAQGPASDRSGGSDRSGRAI